MGKGTFTSTGAALVWVLSAAGAQAGDVHGAVRDLGRAPPANGISGARVQLVPRGGGAPVPAGITNAKGEYRAAKVPDGDYTVVVDALGYVPRPHDRTRRTVKAGGNDLGDVALMRAYGSDAYYMVVAEQLVAAAGKSDSKPKAYAAAWHSLREAGLPPPSKVLLARWIDRRDKDARRALPALNDYLAVNPEDALAVLKDFQSAFAGKAAMPNRAGVADRRAPDQVVADIVLFQLKAPSGSQEQREAFLRQFLSTWEGTAAARDVAQAAERMMGRQRPP
jgi:hypothetical protein